ncbi:MAG: hypothetical protein P5681_22320 [Limnospira sp. PMC 894.15]|nr:MULTISPECIES: hypothetical protein [unclassified Limnospira]MDT9190518.1 hypothetical protein [Limnospira sp. PMC 894.15]MDT9236527.1 hypothetical protein [Limnospira sp. PMC 917.15]
MTHSPSLLDNPLTLSYLIPVRSRHQPKTAAAESREIRILVLVYSGVHPY